MARRRRRRRSSAPFDVAQRNRFPAAVCALGLGLLVLNVLGPVTAVAQDAEPLTGEYFIRQDIGETLFIRIDAYEAEALSRLVDETGQVLLSTTVPGSRLAPLFQYVEDRPDARDLDIAVAASVYTQRSRFEPRISRLVVRDDRSAQLAQAYQYLSFGVETLEVDTAPNWTVKISSLLRAGDGFGRFGMEELRLWSHFLAAHFIHAKLDDASTALDRVQVLRRDPGLGRHPLVAVAVLRLRADVLISLQADPSAAGTSDRSALQEALSDLADAAASRGLQYEVARANYLRGADLAAAGQDSRALVFLEQALGLADELGAGDLANRIRKDIVALHELRGDLAASGSVLRDIESQLSDDGRAEALTQNLLHQGRLQLATFRPEQAISTLTRALQGERNSLMRAQISLALGQAYVEAGRPDEAEASLVQALYGQQTGRLRRPNPALDTAEGLRLLANLKRQQGDWADLATLREAAVLHVQDSVERLMLDWERGRDELARPGGSTAVADRYLTGVAQRAERGGRGDWAALARLQRCAATQNASEPACAPDRLDEDHRRLVAAGQPRRSLEGARLRATALERQGRVAAAQQLRDRLVADVHFYQDRLPGALGAWFWQEREPLLSHYVDTAAQVGDPRAALLAFSRARLAGRNVALSTVPDADEEAVRVLLARRTDPVSGTDTQRLDADIQSTLAPLRSRYNATWAGLSADGMDRWLASLPNDAGLLALDLAGEEPRAWLATAQSVRQFNLPATDDVRDRLAEASAAASRGDEAAFEQVMARLGRQWLSPLPNPLPRRLFWVPTGPMLGHSLGALRRRDRALAEDHVIEAVMDFPAQPLPMAFTAPIEGVFLAGNPVDYRPDHLVRFESPPEVRQVTDAFVGPGLTLLQGSALLEDEFESEAYSRAGLLHLSMPARVDLQRPFGSSLELSEPGRSLGRQRLGAARLSHQAVMAQLAVLSQVTQTGQAPFRFASRWPLASDLLEAGAEQVIVTLWPGEGDTSAALSDRFYRAWPSEAGAAEALWTARSQLRDDDLVPGDLPWIRYLTLRR